MRKVELAQLKLPEFGLPTVQPNIPAETYQVRIEAALERAAHFGYDALLVYGDREHAANVAYLSGYDPRFEETLLILRQGRAPILLLGNEGMSYSRISPLDMDRVLYQTFSLLGQPRGDSPMLRDILSQAGIKSGQRLGIAGWKSFDKRESSEPEHRWKSPPSSSRSWPKSSATAESFTTPTTFSCIRPTACAPSTMSISWHILSSPRPTHRKAVRNLIFGVEPGMSEFDAIALMRLTGMPQSCHLMFSSGERAGLGLASPSLRRLQVGDPTFLAYGIWGALNARGGWLRKRPKRSARRSTRLCRQAGRALLSRYRRLVRGPWHRRDRRRAT